MLQVYFFSNLYPRNDNKNHRKRFYIKQVHVPAESVELAGFRGDNQRLRHHRYGGGKPGGPEDVSSVEGPEDHLNITR